MREPTRSPAARPGPRRSLTAAAVAAATLALALVLAGVAQAAANAYRQTNLVSDVPGLAQVTDPNLVNPWGLAEAPTSPIWVADNETSVATLYAGAVHGSPLQVVPLVVGIPGDAPTGQVFNPTDGFVVSGGGESGPALFIFDSETGHVTGWAPNVPPPPPSTQAQNGVTVPDAIFKGLALAKTRQGTFLYAADFHRNRIVVINSWWHVVHLAGSFRDPNLPDGFAPFNVQLIGRHLYVSYAKQDADAEDEIAGPHLGYVDEYSRQGRLLRRFASGGPLNAPWGLVRARRHFGRFSRDILVGNFGDGRIHAYDAATGRLEGTLRHPSGRPVEIDGLWGLLYGNGTIGTHRTLFFSAGIDDEAHGLFGAIRAAH